MTAPLRFGLLGEHIAYSRSPQIFEAIYRAIGQDGVFTLHSIAGAELETTVRRLRNDSYHGLSITIPHKQAIIPLLKHVEPVAAAIDAVNSVRFDPAGLCGTNTDIAGFVLPLRRQADRLKYGSATVIGCGGAARAVVYALYTHLEMSPITVVARNEVRLRQFTETICSQLDRLDLRARVATLPLEELCNSAIVVNCTPLGGANAPDQLPISPSASWNGVRSYYDLNYNPGNSAIRLARQNGVSTFDGSAMLVGQAIESFHFCTNQIVPFDLIYNSVFGGEPWQSEATPGSR